jgi:hypothetical protein
MNTEWLKGIRRADTPLLLQIMKGGKPLHDSVAAELTKRGHAGYVGFILDNHWKVS